MQHLEVSGAVRPLKWSLGVKWLMVMSALSDVLTSMLLISSLLLGYSLLSTARLKDVPQHRGVFIFSVSFLTASCGAGGT